MRSVQIQHAIAQGLKPFELCHIVSRKVRISRKKGDHIQDSIGAVFHSLGYQPMAFQPGAFPEAIALPPASDIVYTGGDFGNVYGDS